jgi:predicted dehydrogenase
VNGNSPTLHFGVIGLEHVHAAEMTRGLIRAGAVLASVHSSSPAGLDSFPKEFPGTRVASSPDEILEDPSLQLVVSASIPDERAPLAKKALRSGKDFLSAKPFGTTLSQLQEARQLVGETGRKIFIYYSERVNVPSSVMAGEIVTSGRLGKIVHVLCLAPHRLARAGRPAWFFDPAKSGGILADIGSHQFEQILAFGGMSDARISHAFTANRTVPEHPSFEDFGEASVIGGNGVTGYLRVDWLTPEGLGVWGDVRTVLLGTKGTLEIRKYTDIAREQSPDHLYLVDESGEHHLRPDHSLRLPYFGNVIRDCLERTESAMSQEHAFLAMELALTAQQKAHDGI